MLIFVSRITAAHGQKGSSLESYSCPMMLLAKEPTDPPRLLAFCCSCFFIGELRDLRWVAWITRVQVQNSLGMSQSPCCDLPHLRRGSTMGHSNSWSPRVTRLTGHPGPVQHKSCFSLQGFNVYPQLLQPQQPIQSRISTTGLLLTTFGFLHLKSSLHTPTRRPALELIHHLAHRHLSH